MKIKRSFSVKNVLRICGIVSSLASDQVCSVGNDSSGDQGLRGDDSHFLRQNLQGSDVMNDAAKSDTIAPVLLQDDSLSVFQDYIFKLFSGYLAVYLADDSSDKKEVNHKEHFAQTSQTYGDVDLSSFKEALDAEINKRLSELFFSDRVQTVTEEENGQKNFQTESWQGAQSLHGKENFLKKSLAPVVERISENVVEALRPIHAFLVQGEEVFQKQLVQLLKSCQEIRSNHHAYDQKLTQVLSAKHGDLISSKTSDIPALDQQKKPSKINALPLPFDQSLKPWGWSAHSPYKECVSGPITVKNISVLLECMIQESLQVAADLDRANNNHQEGVMDFFGGLLGKAASVVEKTISDFVRNIAEQVGDHKKDSQKKLDQKCTDMEEMVNTHNSCMRGLMKFIPRFLENVSTHVAGKVLVDSLIGESCPTPPEESEQDNTGEKTLLSKPGKFAS